jgi:hypothetical protein
MRCDECKFWANPDDDGVHGICRRFPPVEDCITVKTHQLWWCGEFRSFNADLLDLNESALKFSLRVHTCLKRMGIAKIGDLCRRTSVDLLKCKNFGEGSLKEVKEKLASVGLKLKD